MSGRFVIKIGGSTLGSADTTFLDIAELARGGQVPVVIHGGGAEASRWLEAMSIPSRFEHGLRVTDEQVLPVVVAVFAGLVNDSGLVMTAMGCVPVIAGAALLHARKTTRARTA